jgi:hypothetical protein
MANCLQAEDHILALTVGSSVAEDSGLGMVEVAVS